MNIPTSTGTLLGARYELRGEIGAGGMGVVHRAYDRARGEEVALKTLRPDAPGTLRRLKREFRALSGVIHPNLVALYELDIDDEQGFFTMELVEGEHLLDHVRPALRLDEARLRAAFRQLAVGIAALHAAGKLHCDLKPSNVRVTADGRVKILDFGLVAELDAGGTGAARPRPWGTPTYMAPEQIEAAALTSACDWYAFGVLLYEALTGRPPFDGDAVELMSAKLTRDGPAPSAAVPGVPADLDALCVRLLRRGRAARWAGEEVLGVLLGEGERGASSTPPLPASSAFVGRSEQLRRLFDAFAELEGGGPAVVYVHGDSGIGKTSLVRRFLALLATRARPVIVEGRCYERESMPFKALDGVVDGLASQLGALPDDALAALLPAEAHLLARVFPALAQLRPIRTCTSETPPYQDSQELRRRTFGALGELLRRIAHRAPLVVAIDDAQWGDADSGAVLADLLGAPHAPVLLLLAYRSVDAASSPLLERLFRAREGDVPALTPRDVRLGPLNSAESRELVSSLLGSGSPEAEELPAESGGSPFLVHELLRYALARRRAGRAPDVRALRFDDVLDRRLAELPVDARRLLDVIAVAGYPLREDVAIAAAELLAPSRPKILLLEAERLLAPRASGGGPSFEPYHDRIREAVIERLAPEARRAWHRRLAAVLDAASQPEAQRIVDHYVAAGAPELAARFAVRAGDEATRSLAFERAASHYALAIEHGAGRGDLPVILAKLGDAFASSGRGREAANAFTRAAREYARGRPGAPEALDLQRRAAEQYLRSGFVDEGMSALHVVLASVGARIPGTTAEAMASVLIRRAKLRVRGLGFRPMPRATIPAEMLARLDVLWSAGLGLSMVDTIRSADFQVRHQLLALRVGDRIHVARALTSQIAFLASEGGAANHRRAAEVLRSATQLSAGIDDPSVGALVELCAGVAAYFRNGWSEALTRFRSSERLCRKRCVGVAWEITNTQIYGLWSLAYLGEIAELRDQVPRMLEDARDRGDAFAATSLRLGFPNMVWLTADRPDEARRQADDAMRGWPRAGFLSQHYFELFAQVHIDLYRGDAWAAHRRVEEAWPRLKDAFLLRLQALRVELRHLRARCAIAAAATQEAGAGRSALVARATKEARRIELEATPCSAPFAGAIRSAAAAVAARRDEAASALEGAARGFELAEMQLYARAAGWTFRQLNGGDGGESEAWMRAQGIARPDRIAAMLLPGILPRG